jgi:VanZ family protein
MLKLIAFLRPFALYLLIGWVLFIALFSSLPSIPTLKIQTDKIEIRLDYLIHICEYGWLTFLAFLTFSGREFKVSSRKYLIISLCLTGFAFLDEFHQKFIPGRAYNLNDIISDITGIVAGLVFCVIVFRMMEKKESLK